MNKSTVNKRAKSRRFIALRIWLLEQGIRQKDVAQKADVSESAITLVMQERMTSANVRQAFIDLGCPPEIWEMESA